MSKNKATFDVISFVIGGMLCSLLSVAITVYFINSVNFLYTVAKIIIAVFFLLCISMVLYLFKRGEIWQVLIGKNLHSAQENLADSIKAFLPGYSPQTNSEFSKVDAVQNLTAMYGDYQIRKFIVFCVLAVFGAISALVTAAFLIKQTKVMDKQTVVMGQQSKIMEKQTQLAVDIAKTESLYKPYWDLKHADSKEVSRAAFTTLLNQKETKNFNGIRIEEIDFTPLNGRLTVQGFHCKSCRYTDVQFSRVNWEGDFQIYNSRLINTTYRGGSMNRPVFFEVHISNDDTDDQGTYLRGSFFEAMNVKYFIFHDSILQNAKIVGYSPQELDLFDIESAQKSQFINVVFEDVRITSSRGDEDTFDNTVLENVEIRNGSINGVDLSSADILGKLTLDSVDLKDTSFSESQRSCIDFVKTKIDEVTWKSTRAGNCLAND